MSNFDFRLSVNFRSNHKIQKLEKRLRADGVLQWISILAFAAEARPKGRLYDVTLEDLEVKTRSKDINRLVETLRELKLIDEIDGVLCVHDWAEHQPFATGAPERSAAGRKAAQARWGKHCETTAGGNADRIETHSVGQTIGERNAEKGYARFDSFRIDSNRTGSNRTGSDRSDAPEVASVDAASRVEPAAEGPSPGNPPTTEPTTMEAVTVVPCIADHHWQAFKDAYPRVNGIFMNEDLARTEFLKRRPEWGAIILGAKNYARSSIVARGIDDGGRGVKYANNFIRDGSFKDWQNPEIVISGGDEMKKKSAEEELIAALKNQNNKAMPALGDAARALFYRIGQRWDLLQRRVIDGVDIFKDLLPRECGAVPDRKSAAAGENVAVD